MRGFLMTLIAIGVLAGMLGGCSDTPEPSANGSEYTSDVEASFSDAEQVDLYSGDGTLLRTLKTSDELNVFFDALDLADWDFADEPETRSETELTAVFSKRPTETVLGGKPDEDERQEVIRLTLYEGSDIADLKLALFTVQVKLPEEARAALSSAAQPE